MRKHSLRLMRAGSGLVVVDVQERLLRAIFEQRRVVQNTVRLIQGGAVLDLPGFLVHLRELPAVERSAVAEQREAGLDFEGQQRGNRRNESDGHQSIMKRSSH